MKPNILVICGPTASGKTSLALDIATRLSECHIYSIDSRQSFKELSILTGKDIPSTLPPGVKIFGADMYDAEADTSLANFHRDIVSKIQKSISLSIPVILVGGSGLYLKSLTENLSEIYIPQDKELRRTLSVLDLVSLQEKLKSVNSDLFNRLNNSDKNNPRRLIRHIEKTLYGPTNSTNSLSSANFIIMGLSLSPTSQYDLIIKRIKKRIQDGVIDEVRKFTDTHSHPSPQIVTTLGLAEIRSHLAGDITQDEMIARWAISEMQYAKRQMVWFKKQKGIIWYDENKDRNNIADKYSKLLAENEHK